jgi:hypothetical protein
MILYSLNHANLKKVSFIRSNVTKDANLLKGAKYNEGQKKRASVQAL